MVAIVNKFSYTGTVQEVTIPAGTQSIDIYLWGGAGGGGGPDDNPGGPGTGGQHVKHVGYTGVASNIGNTLQVAVGGGGGGGSSGGGAPGGTNGKSLTDFSGGRGGNAGPAPYSGGGGAGGGATVVTVNGTATHIAAGGGGGGGAGNHSGSTPGINSHLAHSQTPATLGQNGGDHTGDGGGGGAGGGGAAGGKGGAGGSGDNTGQGGYTGSSLFQTGGSSVAASGVTPGGTGESFYVAGTSVGGNPAASGSNGYAVIVFNIGVQANVKVSGDWKEVNDMHVKVSGAWKQITAGYVKVSGAWKALFNSGITFIENAAGFGNSAGVSGAPSGSGGGGCFIAGTMISMADGSLKPVEQVDIGDVVSVGGKVFATGKFLIDNLYDYNGIKVSGTHMVKEDGAWIRVEDSRIGKSLGNDEVIVYVFGNENRRIVINGTEFTDYFELSEQQELINHGEDIFSNWQDHDRQIHDKNVNILNA